MGGCLVTVPPCPLPLNSDLSPPSCAAVSAAKQGITAMPELPSMSGLPDMPDLPALPSLNGLPEMPSLSSLSDSGEPFLPPLSIIVRALEPH